VSEPEKLFVRKWEWHGETVRIVLTRSLSEDDEATLQRALNAYVAALADPRTTPKLSEADNG
jgi:hypothetical protein